jgi:hypothetical protein
MTVAAVLLILSVAEVSRPVIPYACLPPEEFVLGGITTGISLNAVLTTLGPTSQREMFELVDDGGTYSVTRLSYPTLTIDVGDGDRGVERIATASPSPVFGPGVKVGMPLTEVESLLHFRGSYGSEDIEVKIGACGFDWRPEVTLYFDRVPDHPNSQPLLKTIVVEFHGP